MYRRKDEQWATLFRNLRVVLKRCKMIPRSEELEAAEVSNDEETQTCKKGVT